VPADIIKIFNSDFETSLRKALNIPTEIITASNTLAISDLNLANIGVVDLDIEALKALPKLKSINLTNNPLSANAVIVQIPKLESAGIAVDLGTSAAAKVELSSEKPAIPASLSATTDVTVTVTDANGNKVKRETINLSVDKGTIQTPAVNNGDGTYTAKYTAGKTAGQAKISVVTSNGKFASITIELLELVLSVSKSTLELAGSAAVQTGELASVLVTLKDDNGLPIADREVTLVVDPADNLKMNPSNVTDQDGKAIFSLISTQPGMRVITASVGEVKLDANVAVIFSGDIVAMPVTMGIDPNRIKWEKDGAEMVLIPAGSFKMGNHSGESLDRNTPVHMVELDTFYMDVLKYLTCKRPHWILKR